MLQDSDTETHVAIVDDRDLRGGPIQQLHLSVVQAADTADQWFVVTNDGIKHCGRSLGQTEIDDDVRRCDDGIEVSVTCPDARQLQIRLLLDTRGYGLTHAASAGNTYF
jgi:hypothetical protein